MVKMQLRGGSLFWTSLQLLLMTLVLNVSVSAESLTPQRLDELRNLLDQDCGSCHGMTRKGGLGPALTVEALKNKPIELIAASIREGRPGTPMPPWKNLLSEADIQWLAQTLKQEALAQQ